MPECTFISADEKSKKVEEFLREYGDDLPETALEYAVTDLLDNFALECNEDNNIISGVTFQPATDWYLCTIKYLATHPDHRRKGLGTKVTREVMDKANEYETPDGWRPCKVLTADVTYDNTGSKKIFQKAGFKDINRFCWLKGEKPADILHLVKFPPEQGNTCTEPE